jgi:hypothetical protein
LSLQDILIQGFAEIIRLLGGEIPEAWKKVLEATRQAADEAGRYADEVRRARYELESMPAPRKPGGGEVGAQHGFFGIVSRPTRFLVGEAGPELVAVLRNPRPVEGGGGGLGGPVIVQVVTPDGRELARQVLEEADLLSRSGRVALHLQSIHRIR